MRALIPFLIVLAAPPALAFDEAAQFFAPSGTPHAATLGASAEGIYFTGAPRFSGLDCSSCHTGGPGHLRVALDADDATLLTSGYVPGQTYELAVSITHETEGLEYASPTCTEVPGPGDTFTYEQCNHNNFALEIDDETDAPHAGVLCAAPPDAAGCPAPSADADEAIVAPGGDAVFANHAHSMSMPYELLHNDVTAWHLWWTAPPAGTGALQIYVAAVDGNGGGGTVTDDQDPYGDDTARKRLIVAEQGAVAASGCSIAPGNRGALLPVLLLIAFAWRRRRAVLVLVLAGCGNGPLMSPGSDCLSCHSKGGGAQTFSVAGTVFPNGASPPDVGLDGATVHITDATGAEMDLLTNAAGNFYADDHDAPLTFPLVVTVERDSALRTMEPTVMDGSCNHCHALPPKESAQGRVYIPSPPP